jgi:hypothetical protein
MHALAIAHCFPLNFPCPDHQSTLDLHHTSWSPSANAHITPGPQSTNFGFLHPSTIPRSSGELPTPPPLSFSSTCRYRTSSPRPTTPSAPHQPPEADSPLPYRPSLPQLAECRSPPPLVRTRAPPRCRSPLPGLPLFNLTWGKASPHFPGARAHCVPPCSPVSRWER